MVYCEFNDNFFCYYLEFFSLILFLSLIEWYEGNGVFLICIFFIVDLLVGLQIFRWQKDGCDIFFILGVIVIYNLIIILSVFEFKWLIVGDLGEYICIVSNRVGKMSVFVDMVVYGLCLVKNLIRKFIIECKFFFFFRLEQFILNIFNGFLIFLSKVIFFFCF